MSGTIHVSGPAVVRIARAIALCAGMVVLGGGATAVAQTAGDAAKAEAGMKDTAPYYGVVTAADTAVRCKDSERYYKVGELPMGQVVMVDGESSTWVRIGYPASLSAFARVEDVDVNGKSATLKVDSRLKAANATSGYVGSWQPLLPTAAKAGTVLTIVEPVTDSTGPVIAYRVVPPKEARAFVESRSVRRATDAEVEAFRAKTGAPSLAAKPVEPEAKPAVPAATTPEAKPIDLTAPVDPGATVLTQGGSNPEGVRPETAKPETATPGQEQPAAGPEPVAATPEVVVTARPVVRPPSPFVALESGFQALARRTNVAVDEFEELISEYEKAIGDEPSGRRREGMQARVEYLKLRRDAAETVRRQEEARAALDSNKVRINEQLAEVQRSRVYTIIGQIQPSTVYDGKDLPLMYRVVSVGGSSPRTLGYLKKSDEFDFDRMLGLVIGVIGETQIDRSLRLNIITPVRVEVLKPGTTGETLKVEAAPTTAPAEPADAMDGN